MINFLNAFFADNETCEIRVLGAGRNNKTVLSGFFQRENFNKITTEIKKLNNAYGGIYFTPNPVANELTALANNRLVAGAKSTSDNDVIDYRWLLIDVDAVRRANGTGARLSGIPATETEREHAHVLFNTIINLFDRNGIFVDSGNGYQAYYRVNGLTAEFAHNFLIALSKKYNNENAEVDVSVHNPARIMRLPSTWNRKGDGTTERRHRQAEVISDLQYDILTPDYLSILIDVDIPYQPEAKSDDFLTAIFGDIKKIEYDVNFDIKDFIHKHFPGADEKSYKDGTKYILPECPFNADHKAPDSAIFVRNDGVYGFKCFHNSCSSYEWHDLRERLEPKQIKKEVVISKTEKTISENNKFTLSETMLDCPGFVNDLMEYTLDTAHYPNKVLAFAGALSMLSFIIARKVCDSERTRPNLYLLGLANSGYGKDAPRKTNMKLAAELGIINLVGDEIGTGQGIQDKILLHSKLFLQTDEFDKLLDKLEKDAHSATVINNLLTIFTSADSVLPRRITAGTAGSKKDIPDLVHYPHLTIFGTCIPRYFYSALSLDLLENGFFSRLLIMESYPREVGQTPLNLDIPKKVIDFAKGWVEFETDDMAIEGNIPGKCPTPFMVYHDEVAQRYREKTRLECEAKYTIADKSDDSVGRAVYTRTYEIINRLALLRACSRDNVSPTITLADMQWAAKLGINQSDAMIASLSNHGQPVDIRTKKICDKILNKLRSAEGNTMSRSKLSKDMRLKANELNAIIDMLIESEEITSGKLPTGGCPKVFYKLA